MLHDDPFWQSLYQAFLTERYRMCLAKSTSHEEMEPELMQSLSQAAAADADIAHREARS